MSSMCHTKSSCRPAPSSRPSPSPSPAEREPGGTWEPSAATEPADFETLLQAGMLAEPVVTCPHPRPPDGSAPAGPPRPPSGAPQGTATPAPPPAATDDLDRFFAPACPAGAPQLCALGAVPDARDPLARRPGPFGPLAPVGVASDGAAGTSADELPAWARELERAGVDAEQAPAGGSAGVDPAQASAEGRAGVDAAQTPAGASADGVSAAARSKDSPEPPDFSWARASYSRDERGDAVGMSLGSGLDAKDRGYRLQLAHKSIEGGFGGDLGLYGIRGSGTLMGWQYDPSVDGETGFWGGARFLDAGVTAGYDHEAGTAELGYRADVAAGDLGARALDDGNGSDRGLKLGFSLGFSNLAARAHAQDRDGDCRPEYGLGLSVPAGPIGLSIDYTTETPFGDFLLGGYGGNLWSEGMKGIGIGDYAPTQWIDDAIQDGLSLRDLSRCADVE